jgi:gas vesicle protein
MALAAGITIGLLVGAGAVLLFAPLSGEDTRHAIARSGRRLARRGRDAWSDLRYELRRYERRSRKRREASSL